MKRLLFANILAVFAVMLWHGTSGQAQKTNPATHGWLTDLNQAKKLSRETGKPMMVVFRCEP